MRFTCGAGNRHVIGGEVWGPGKCGPEDVTEDRLVGPSWIEASRGCREGIGNLFELVLLVVSPGGVSESGL